MITGVQFEIIIVRINKKFMKGSPKRECEKVLAGIILAPSTGLATPGLVIYERTCQRNTGILLDF